MTPAEREFEAWFGSEVIGLPAFKFPNKKEMRTAFLAGREAGLRAAFSVTTAKTASTQWPTVLTWDEAAVQEGGLS